MHVEDQVVVRLFREVLWEQFGIPIFSQLSLKVKPLCLAFRYELGQLLWL